jgi:hypothetical protein
MEASMSGKQSKATTDRAARLEAAIQAGYVVTASNEERQTYGQDYYDWCRKAGVGYIRVGLEGRYAHVHFDAETSGRPYTERVRAGGRDEIWALIEPVGTRKTIMAGRTFHVGIHFLPREHADRVAAALRAAVEKIPVNELKEDLA